jgi:hypothetical protein
MRHIRQPIVLRIAVERCHLNGDCTQRWEALEPVRDNPRMRYCGLCRSAVHLVEHESDMLELARLGKCVAVVREDPIEAGNSPLPDQAV